MTGVKPGTYILATSFIGYQAYNRPIYIGSLSPFIDLGFIELEQSPSGLREGEITATQEAVCSNIGLKNQAGLFPHGLSHLHAIDNPCSIEYFDGVYNVIVFNTSTNGIFNKQP